MGLNKKQFINVGKAKQQKDKKPQEKKQESKPFLFTHSGVPKKH